MLFMYLCEVAIVSELCILPLYLLHGLCEDYLICDTAFNAVMPLSRASTRGRYSRIEGVTGSPLLHPAPASRPGWPTRGLRARPRAPRLLQHRRGCRHRTGGGATAAPGP